MSQTLVCQARPGRNRGQVLIIVLGIFAIAPAERTLMAEDQPALASIATLTARLSNNDAKARAQSARDLWRRGREAQPAAAALVAALADRDPMVRAYAARALANVGQGNAAAMSALAKLLLDSDVRVRRAASASVRVLLPDPQKFGAEMLGAVEKADSDVAAAVIEALVASGDRAVPVLIRGLENPGTRYWAAVALADFGPAAKDAVPALVKALGDKRPEMRLQVLMALGAVGPEAAGSVNAISKHLTAAEPGVRYAAAFALGSIGAPAALNKLQPLVEKQDDSFLKMLAMWGLARQPHADPALVREAVRVFVQNLKSNDARVRQAAARALADVEADPELAAPMLIAELKDADPVVRSNVASAIASLGADVVPRLTSALKDDELRPAAVEALRRIGPPAKDATSALSALVEQLAVAAEEKELLADVLIALGAIGNPPPQLIDVCAELLNNDDPRLASAAAYVLGKLGPPASAALPQLKARVQSPDADSRLIALWAILNISPEKTEIVDKAIGPLTAALADPRELVRLEAAAVLGKLGARAKESVSALERLKNDNSPEVRNAAAEALRSIQGT